MTHRTISSLWSLKTIVIIPWNVYKSFWNHLNFTLSDCSANIFKIPKIIGLLYLKDLTCFLHPENTKYDIVYNSCHRLVRTPPIILKYILPMYEHQIGVSLTKKLLESTLFTNNDFCIFNILLQIILGPFFEKLQWKSSPRNLNFHPTYRFSFLN